MTFIACYIGIGLIFAVIAYFDTTLGLGDDSRESNERSMLGQMFGYFTVVILWPIPVLNTIRTMIDENKRRGFLI